MGHFPLQTTLLYAATPDIIRFLIRKNENAAKNIDIEGRTSLHLVFDDYERMEMSNSFSTREIFQL